MRAIVLIVLTIEVIAAAGEAVVEAEVAAAPVVRRILLLTPDTSLKTLKLKLRSDLHRTNATIGLSLVTFITEMMVKKDPPIRIRRFPTVIRLTTSVTTSATTTVTTIATTIATMTVTIIVITITMTVSHRPQLRSLPRTETETNQLPVAVVERHPSQAQSAVMSKLLANRGTKSLISSFFIVKTTLSSGT